MADPRDAAASSEEEDWDAELEEDSQIEEEKDGAAVYTMQSVNGMVTITPVAGNLKPDQDPVEVDVEWAGRAEEVSIFTSFDDFETPIPLGLGEDALGNPQFNATLKLPPGRYLVRYEVDGEWAVDESEDVIYSLGNEYNALVIDDPNAPPVEFDESSDDSGSDWDVDDGALGGDGAAGEAERAAESIRGIVAAVNQSVPESGGASMVTITPNDFLSVSKELELGKRQRQNSVVWDPARQAFVMGGGRGHRRHGSRSVPEGDEEAAAAGDAAVVQDIPSDLPADEAARLKKEKEREKRRRKKKRRREKKRQKAANRAGFAGAAAGAVRPRGTGSRHATDQAWLQEELARREKEWREAWILHELKSEERRESDKQAMREQWKGERDVWIAKVQNYAADNNQLRDDVNRLTGEVEEARRGSKLVDSGLERKHAQAQADADRLTGELAAARAELAAAREEGRASAAAALDKERAGGEELAAAQREGADARAKLGEAEVALQGARRETEDARAEVERLKAGAAEVREGELDAVRGELAEARRLAADAEGRLKAAEALAAEAQADAAKRAAAAKDLEARVAETQQAQHAAEAAAEQRVADLEKALAEQRDAAAGSKAEAERLAGELDAAKEGVEAAKAAAVRERAELERRLAESRQTQAGLGQALRKLASVTQALRADLKAVREHASRDVAVIKTELAENTQFLTQSLQLQTELLRSTMLKYRKEMSERRKYFNLVQELRGNIRVSCRARPMLPHDEKRNTTMACVFPDKGSLTVESEKRGKVSFEFDNVFSPDSQQEDVFRETKDLVKSVADGYNVCIFAYGQTGSGKTWSMSGSPENRGLNHRALIELFRLRDEREDDFEYDFTVSVVEIYNEQLRDLLNKDPVGNASKLKIHKGANGVYVDNLEEWDVDTMEDVLDAIKTGERNRAQNATDMNAHSSRSHAMVTVRVTGKHRTAGITFNGKLHMIDLAGSERIAKSGATGQRLKEAQAINKSLSALGNVLESLQKKQSHIPYRDSKLTWCLQDSLGGNAKVMMLAAISPTAYDAEETINTLRFAERARKVELGGAKRNIKRPGAKAGAKPGAKAGAKPDAKKKPRPKA